MRKFIFCALLVSAIGTASGMEATASSRATAPGQRGSQASTAASLNATGEGVITSVDLAAAKIGIADRSMLIDSAHVTVQDKRSNADGFLRVADLKVGMRVRYQIKDETRSAARRVTALWVLGDGGAKNSALKPGSAK
jgi:hypothetical protein